MSDESILSLNPKLHGIKKEPVNVRVTSVLFCEEDDVTVSSIGMKKGDV